MVNIRNEIQSKTEIECVNILNNTRLRTVDKICRFRVNTRMFLMPENPSNSLQNIISSKTTIS